ncbi:MAG: hypothetical protein K2X27_07535 [Candidatus Obscuribacterales bacterium]|nr:hypothetical protein [Candidatus Obscuribacterales bacterium]
MTTYFAPIARLLGDLVVCLPPLQNLIETKQNDDELCLVIRSAAQEGLAQRVPGLKSWIRESDFLKLSLQTESRVYNLREHPLQMDFVWGSPEFYQAYPGYGITEIIRDICSDFGIRDAQEKLIALNTNKRSESKGKILLIPGTAGPIKRWPSRYWLEIFQMLKNAGRETLMLGEPAKNTQVKELIEAALPWIETPTVADALDLITAADGVVAVDTGLMHLAVHQRIKTVAIFREYTMFLRPYEHVRYLIAPPCASQCRKDEFNFSPNSETYYADWDERKLFDYWQNLNCKLSESESCMSALKSNQILEELRKLGLL